MTKPPAAPTPQPASPSAQARLPERWSGVLETLVRVGGAVIAVWGGMLLAFYATFMTPYRIGTTLVPVSVVLVIVGNAALIWFSYCTTRNKFLALLPGLVWLGLAYLGADRTTKGDLVLYQKNWVGTVYLFAGAGTVAVAAYRLIVPKPPPPPASVRSSDPGRR
jgi:hypothetical protein